MTAIDPRATLVRLASHAAARKAIVALLALQALVHAPAVALAQAPAAAPAPAPAAAPAPAPAAAPAPAPAPSGPIRYVLGDGALQQLAPDGSVAPLPLPCPATVLGEAGGRLFLGCPGGKVAVLCLPAGGPPTPCGTLAAGGEVAGFHAAGGRLWVEVRRSEARPIEELGLLPAEAAGGAAGAVPVVGAVPAPAPAALPTALAGSAAGPREGTVVESASGRVVVDLGSAHFVRRGQRLALFREHSVDLGGGMSSTEEELLAIGEVSAVSEQRCQVQLGLNERVPAGARARRTSERATENRYVPPRTDKVWELGFMFRPFLAVGAFGFGTLSDGTVSLRHPDKLRLQLLLSPLGLGYADEGNVLSVAGNLLATYDTQVFEIGLGLGWSAVNERLERVAMESTDERGAGAIETSIDEVKSGMSIVQFARLGATDGLHVAVLNTFLLYDETFHYGGTVGQLQIPVSRRSWLLLRGGGGSAGYGFGEAGLRWLARGNGDRGSLFLTVTAGGAALSGQKEETCTYPYETAPGLYVDRQYDCSVEVSYGGPMVGFGAEWRL